MAVAVAVAEAQRGDGRDVMTWPLGLTKVSFSLALPDMDQSFRCITPW